MPVTTKLVQSLAQLPLELALEIINDLRLWDVIKLMLRNNPKVNQYLLAHDRCRELLGGDGEVLASNREQFQAHLDFAQERNINLRLPHETYYEVPISTRSLGWSGFPSDWHLLMGIHHRLWSAIPDEQEELLAHYIPGPTRFPSISFDSSVEDYKRWWDVMTEAKDALTRKCVDQVLHAAELLEKNPDILKFSSDRAQVRRPNTQHIVSEMHRRTHKLLHRNAWDFRRSHHFRYEFYPIIPFDNALAELLRMMEKRRMTSGEKILLAGPQSPAVKKLVQTVVEGIPYFYPLDPDRPAEIPDYFPKNPKGDIARTENTPWSYERENKDQPEDLIVPAFTPSARGSDPTFFGRRRGFSGQEPHSQKEEEWLDAFVELYRYLERVEEVDQGHR
ncbi:hypothetical protein N7492_005803 [Penicillium capsulatum]|uniref:Uncharacterized protein n=1 Tax=Penicillium capsulatum TaxID=69766 RepID=A0A9W9ICZ1_9EURO|nr:hypothetical protein N7492_005803 [Penicillium capsulatum]KAJ6135097.1 hypothetical protein N7512_000257 [Penicillium capsulatum]